MVLRKSYLTYLNFLRVTLLSIKIKKEKAPNDSGVDNAESIN